MILHLAFEIPVNQVQIGLQLVDDLLSSLNLGRKLQGRREIVLGLRRLCEDPSLWRYRLRPALVGDRLNILLV